MGGNKGLFLVVLCCSIFVVIFTFAQRDPVVSTSQQAEVAETSGGTDGRHDLGLKMATEGEEAVFFFFGGKYSFIS